MSLSKIFVNNTQIVGVDDEPTAGSDNLVKSGAVAQCTYIKVPYTFTSGDYYANFSIPKITGITYSVKITNTEGFGTTALYLLKNGDNNTARALAPDNTYEAQFTYTDDDLVVGRDTFRLYAAPDGQFPITCEILINVNPFDKRITDLTILNKLKNIGESVLYESSVQNIILGTKVDFTIPQIVGFRYKLRLENGYSNFVGYLMKDNDESTAIELEPNSITGEVETLYTDDDLTVGRNKLRFYSLASKENAKIVISLNPFQTTKYPKIMAVIGDSFSAYPGYVPEGYECWYPQPSINDVSSAQDMWWYKFASKTGCRLADRNESISGTCICKTTRPTQETLSFVDRVTRLKDAELFIIEGGTNDEAVSAPMGDYKYSDWTSADLFNFRPALAYVIDYIKNHFAGADILFMMNDALSDTMKTSITTICRYYNVRLFAMQSISKHSGHPSVDGHTQICNQLIDLLDKNIGFNNL